MERTLDPLVMGGAVALLVALSACGEDAKEPGPGGMVAPAAGAGAPAAGPAAGAPASTGGAAGAGAGALGDAAAPMTGPDAGADTAVPAPDLPSSLPIDFTRPAAGPPLDPAAVTAFTTRLTRFFRSIDLFRWLRGVSFGADASLGPEFACWWTFYDARKSGGEVTLRALASGVPDNLMGPSAQMLSSVAAAYLLTEDATAGRVAELHAKCVTAQFLGMVFADGEPVPPIMARSVMVRNHTEILEDGAVKHVDLGAWREDAKAGNTESFEIPNNPSWGSIWVRNTRSKDDVAQLYSAAVSLRYLAAGAAGEVVGEAATTAYEHMYAFAQEVFEQGYRIPTRGPDGMVFLPDGDLASFVSYDALLPNAECTPKLSTALFATGAPQGIDCGAGLGALEELVVGANAFNLDIIRRFHVAATQHALLAGETEVARELLEGLAMRADADLARATPPSNIEPVVWEGNFAVHLLRAAAAGLPLTADEARYVHRVLGRALDELEAWPNWKLWDATVPDGTYPPQPFPGIGMWDVMAVFDACASALANPTSASPIECDLLADSAAW